MAHRLAYKINRFTLLNNFKTNYGRFQSTKIKVVDKFPPKSNPAIQQNVEGNIQKVSYSSQNGAQSKRETTPGQLKTFPRTPNTTEYCAPQVVATVATGPQIDLPPRRRFEKSNTHNALTQPLKLPRLANPFPEPVKTLMSHTVSDKEKQDLMFAEIKMEQQFLEQQKREALLKQEELKYQQDLDKYQKRASDNYSTYNQNETMQSYNQNETMQSYNQPQNMAPAPQREIKDVDLYKPKQMLQQDVGPTTAKKMSVMDAFNTGKRYYSSYVKSRYCIHPDTVPTPVQEAEMILNSLKSFYPEHELPRKSLFTPGSAEEKKFIEKTLQFLAKHKRMMHKSNAPFPSYSEVKTFVRRPSFKLDPTEVKTRIASEVDSNRPINTNSLWKRNYTTFTPRLFVRGFGTKIQCVKKKSSTCPVFHLKKCKKPHPEKCMRLVQTKKCKKLEAPYPAYTDCVESPYQAWPSECRLCPWLSKGIDYSKINRKYSTVAGMQGVRHFNTTSTNAFKKVMKVRPKPCKNPAKLKPCNYVKTASNRDKIRKKYRGHPQKPNYRSMKRLYSTAAGPVTTGEPASPVSNAIREPGSPISVDFKAGCGRAKCDGKVQLKRRKSTKSKKGKKRKSKKSKKSKKSRKRKDLTGKKKCRAPKKRPVPTCKSANPCGRQKKGC